MRRGKSKTITTVVRRPLDCRDWLRPVQPTQRRLKDHLVGAAPNQSQFTGQNQNGAHQKQFNSITLRT
jgi:hypothetical protein